MIRPVKKFSLILLICSIVYKFVGAIQLDPDNQLAPGTIEDEQDRTSQSYPQLNIGRPAVTSTGPQKLFDSIIKTYDKRSYPSNTTVLFSAILTGLRFEEGIKLRLYFEMIFKWMDSRLKWDPSNFDMAIGLMIHQDDIWLPEISLYNTWEYKCLWSNEERVKITYLGEIEWTPFCYAVPRCNFRFDLSPYEIQSCTLILGSWVSNGFLPDIQLVDDKLDMNSFNGNDDNWELVGTPHLFKTEMPYTDCPEHYYVDVRIELHFRRKREMGIKRPVEKSTESTKVFLDWPDD